MTHPSSRLWLDSYPDLVFRAHQAWAAQRWLEAGRLYWFAACLSHDDRDEQTWLNRSWIAGERARGRRSDLEAA